MLENLSYSRPCCYYLTKLLVLLKNICFCSRNYATEGLLLCSRPYRCCLRKFDSKDLCCWRTCWVIQKRSHGHLGDRHLRLGTMKASKKGVNRRRMSCLNIMLVWIMITKGMQLTFCTVKIDVMCEYMILELANSSVSVGGHITI
jgi:hypothetical protein